MAVRKSQNSSWLTQSRGKAYFTTPSLNFLNAGAAAPTYISHRPLKMIGNVVELLAR